MASVRDINYEDRELVKGLVDLRRANILRIDMLKDQRRDLLTEYTVQVEEIRSEIAKLQQENRNLANKHIAEKFDITVDEVYEITRLRKRKVKSDG